jgi:hypothetical protein
MRGIVEHSFNLLACAILLGSLGCALSVEHDATGGDVNKQRFSEKDNTGRRTKGDMLVRMLIRCTQSSSSYLAEKDAIL